MSLWPAVLAVAVLFLVFFLAGFHNHRFWLVLCAWGAAIIFGWAALVSTAPLLFGGLAVLLVLGGAGIMVGL